MGPQGLLGLRVQGFKGLGFRACRFRLRILGTFQGVTRDNWGGLGIAQFFVGVSLRR